MLTQLAICDQRILEFMDLLMKEEALTQKEFCEKIGVNRKVISNIRNGEQSFTVTHIKNLCTLYKVNANWIMGLESKVFRK